MAPLPGWPGLLPAAIGANAAGRGIVCPAELGGEAAWAGDIDVLAPASLLSLVNHVTGSPALNRPSRWMTRRSRICLT